MTDNAFNRLPSVNEVLGSEALVDAARAHPRALIVEAVRQELALLRDRVRQGQPLERSTDAGALGQRIRERLMLTDRPRLRPVINATGIVLHTNLGRAPMAEAAAQAVYQAARGYLNLELDLETGKRSSRQISVRDWLCRLTGAESGTVVNNNAAATVIVLHTLCQGKEVILSRGQLVEIGGSFRIPEIMAVSGAILREVGTTNITRLSDYERAISANTAALLRVHPSNYRIRGYTESVSLQELVDLGRTRGIPVIDDIGSGALLDLNRVGFDDEPVARSSVASGADLVIFSGDKLLGGPQAGIIVGKKVWIERIEKDPLMRAFRLDKMSLCALETTLRIYLNEEQAWQKIPVLHMLTMPLQDLQTRAEALVAALAPAPEIQSIRAVQGQTYVGGGSLPDQPLADLADRDFWAESKCWRHLSALKIRRTTRSGANLSK